MRFCPGMKCAHYSRATKYPRACYFEPQCWKGYLDMAIFTIAILIKRGLSRPQTTGQLETKREEETSGTSTQ